jgi:hypothetical protein
MNLIQIHQLIVMRISEENKREIVDEFQAFGCFFKML